MVECVELPLARKYGAFFVDDLATVGRKLCASVRDCLIIFGVSFGPVFLKM